MRYYNKMYHLGKHAFKMRFYFIAVLYGFSSTWTTKYEYFCRLS